MTPDEYRKKHKRCATCIYCILSNFGNECICSVKNLTTYRYNGRFCKAYKVKEFEKNDTAESYERF